MEEKIAECLQEIYEIDPGLKQKESKVLKMLSESLKADPSLEIDGEFVSEIRKELFPAAALLKNNTKARCGLLSCRACKIMGKQKIFCAAMALLVFTVVFIMLSAYVFVVNNYVQDADTDAKNQISISSKVSIAQLGREAFGVLSDLSAQKGAESKDTSSIAMANDATSIPAVAQDAAPTGAGGGAAGSNGTKITSSYQPTYYSYVYKGADFSQNETQMNVLKRIPQEISSGTAEEISSKTQLGLFDFSKLADLKVSNISFFEDRNYGYRIDADLSRGVISLYKNWEKWPSACGVLGSGAYDSKIACLPERLTASDVPADEKIIAASNQFLDKYTVDLSAYGQPQVNKDFTRYYANAADIYYPEEISVVYPFQINGMGVYESYGDVSGLNVSYNIRDAKISSVNNLMTRNYQSSAYNAETDVQNILNFAENIDGNMPLVKDGNIDFKKVEIELDTPVLGYEHFWRYENNGQSSEFLVPCLVFPAKNSLEPEVYYRKNVVVPIIKDFLNQNNNEGIVVPTTDKANVAGSSVAR